jgi:hypothetical protein
MQMKLGPDAEGLMGGLVYGGLTIASIIAGPAFQKYNVKRLLVCDGYVFSLLSWMCISHISAFFSGLDYVL